MAHAVSIPKTDAIPAVQVRHLDRRVSCQPCPACGQASPRVKVYQRRLHDLGDLARDRPVELRVTYSQHRCRACGRYFSTDLTDLADPVCQYTRRVQDLAVRLVVEDHLGYRPASLHLWRDHRVFVPFATIQNWVEAAGKKGAGRVAAGPAVGRPAMLGLPGRR